MITIFVIIALHILYFQRQDLPVQWWEEATYIHNYMPHTLDGLEPSQGHPKVKHIRPCHCCLHRTVSPSMYLGQCQKMIQDKFYQKLKDDACQVKQLDLYTPWSNSKKREKRFRNRLVISFCRQEYQALVGWLLRVLIWPILFINWTGRHNIIGVKWNIRY